MDTAPQNRLEIAPASPDDVERVWVGYWAPLLAEGGTGRLKGELYDAWFLVNQARQVYRHITGGLTDDLCASAEGIIAMADARVGDLTRSLQERIAELEAELRQVRDPG